MREYSVTVMIGKYFIKGMRRQTIKQKILASQKTEKGLKKKMIVPWKNGQETCSGSLQNRISKWPIIICVPKYVYENTHKVLFLIAKIQKQGKYPSMEKWINCYMVM